jgi:hypothetical protein
MERRASPPVQVRWCPRFASALWTLTWDTNFNPCHPERSEALAERSRKPALSEVEGDLVLPNDTTGSDRNPLMERGASPPVHVRWCPRLASALWTLTWDTNFNRCHPERSEASRTQSKDLVLPNDTTGSDRNSLHSRSMRSAARPTLIRVAPSSARTLLRWEKAHALFALPAPANSRAASTTLFPISDVLKAA